MDIASCQCPTSELSLAKEKPLQHTVRSELSHQQPTPAIIHVFTMFSDFFCCSLKQVFNTCVGAYMQIVWGRVIHLDESCSSLPVSSTKASSQASVNDNWPDNKNKHGYRPST